MGDGRTFEQAVRCLDRLTLENDRRLNPLGSPDPGSPIRQAYERIANGSVGARSLSAANG
ncbi:MAG TPA: hypothetical protein VHV52_13705 [Gaiellaceae bacterium]|jgi:hypothetical protein|nr:hypothetical protein [Gaiellaceae bacterium]